MKNYRKPLANTELHYFDIEQAINDIRPSANYTGPENLAFVPMNER